jgi:hypothetical protein
MNTLKSKYPFSLIYSTLRRVRYIIWTLENSLDKLSHGALKKEVIYICFHP